MRQQSVIDQRLDKRYEHMIAWRRYLHQYPELSFQEKETAKWIAARLKEMGCDLREGVGGNGIIATIKGKHPGPTIALRADMDALPIQDEKLCEYASKVTGVMHACGHDGHTAALLAVADYYVNHSDELAGERRLLFQPAEESFPGGAIAMINDGAMEGVDVIYGVHLWTPLAYGSVASKAGAFMSAADGFMIEIEGKGGHGGMPHETIDAIIVGTTLVQGVQTIISRNVNPLHPAVVTIGSFQAGSTNNVIAEKCRLKGTVRSFDERTRADIHKRLEALVRHTCEMHGAKFSLNLRKGYPAVVNDERETERFFTVAEELFGAEKVVHSEALTIAEDFSYFLQHKPGCFLLVGAGNPDCGANHSHHHPLFDIDERAMLNSARLLISLAENYASEQDGH